MPKNDQGEKYHVDINGNVHKSAEEAMQENNRIEADNGRHPTGGNCGQDPSKVSGGSGNSNSNGNSNSSGKK